MMMRMVVRNDGHGEGGDCGSADNVGECNDQGDGEEGSNVA